MGSGMGPWMVVVIPEQGLCGRGCRRWQGCGVGIQAADLGKEAIGSCLMVAPPSSFTSHSVALMGYHMTVWEGQG